MSANGLPSGTQPESVPAQRRRKYIINPAFQWKYAITLSLAVFLVSSILSCVLFATLHDQARQRTINPTEAASSASWVMLVAALGFSFLTAGTVGFWMVVTTHRVCGPLYVLNGYFQRLADGRLPRLRPLRRKDEFKDLFRTFSRAVDRVRSDREAALSTVASMMATASVDPTGDPEECRKALQSVGKQLESLRGLLQEGLSTEASMPAKRSEPTDHDQPKPASTPQRTPVGVG